MGTGKKMNNTTLRLALLIIVIIGAFAAAGCIFSPEPPDEGPGEDPVVPDSPENVIYNLEIAYNKRDINLYKQCLSPQFTFYFNPIDVGNDVNGYEIPTSWGYEEDWTATQNMFTFAYDISMWLPANDIGTPPDGASSYNVDNISVSLLVMVDADNGFIANLGTVEFTFETYDSNGKTYWRVKDWRDFTFA
jgi:hypothetical protein